MPWTEVYFLNRSTLAALSCSPPVSTAPGPSSSVIAATIDWRFSGERDGAMSVLPSFFPNGPGVAPLSSEPDLADEVAPVDDQDVAVDVVRGPAGQEDGGSHQVGGLAPAVSRDVLDNAAMGDGVGPGRCGDRCRDVSRCDGIDLDVVGRQLVAVSLGEAHDPGFARGVGRRVLTAEEGEQRGDIDDLAGSLPDHEPAGLVGELEGGGQVDRHHGVPLLTAEPRHVRQQVDAGRIDEDVDGAQRFHAALHDDRRYACLRDVGYGELHPASGALDQPAGGPVVVGQADGEHVRARLGQGEREGPAQAGVAAGNESVPPGEGEQVKTEVSDIHGSAAIRGEKWVGSQQIGRMTRLQGRPEVVACIWTMW